MKLSYFLITIPLMLPLANNGWADNKYPWVVNLLNHPNVEVKKGPIEEQFWRIQELEALRGFDVQFSSSGNLPLLGEFKDDFNRDSKGEMYLDLTMSGNYTLYDSGFAQNNIEAETLLLQIKRLELVDAVEQESNALLNLVISNQDLMRRLSHLKAAEPELESLKRQLTIRYEAGLGTLTDIRKIQIQLLEIASDISLLENSLNQIRLTATEQYALSSGDLEAIWHDTEYLFAEVYEDSMAQRSENLSQLKIQSLMFQQASVKAQTMPSLVGTLETKLYDVTRGLSNYKLSGQINLKMPLYDSGYSDARLARLNQASLTEVEANHQLQRQKENQLSQNQRQQEDIKTQKLVAIDKLENLSQQLNSLNKAIGNTSSNVNGVAALVEEIARTQAEMTSLNAEAKRNKLERLLIMEQLLDRLAINVEEYL